MQAQRVTALYAQESLACQRGRGHCSDEPLSIRRYSNPDVEMIADVSAIVNMKMALAEDYPSREGRGSSERLSCIMRHCDPQGH